MLSLPLFHAGATLVVSAAIARGVPIAVVESFDGTRAFRKRFAASMGGRMPTMMQAGGYSATLHNRKAMAAMGPTDDGAAVVRKMKSMPTSDIAFGEGRLREDGRKIHNMYLFEVKKPEESKGPWDYYKLLATIPAETAFRPLEEGECVLVKR